MFTFYKIGLTQMDEFREKTYGFDKENRHMRKFYKKNRYILISLFMFIICIFHTQTVFADTKTFSPLVGIPGLESFGNSDEKTNLPDYLNAIYRLLIIIGSLYGVIRIIMSGVKYSIQDVAPVKAEAKNDILGILFGLIVLLLPYIVLKTINPNLTNLDILRNASDIGVNLGTDKGIQRSASDIAQLKQECLDDEKKSERGLNYINPFAKGVNWDEEKGECVRKDSLFSSSAQTMPDVNYQTAESVCVKDGNREFIDGECFAKKIDNVEIKDRPTCESKGGTWEVRGQKFGCAIDPVALKNKQNADDKKKCESDQNKIWNDSINKCCTNTTAGPKC